MLALNYFSMKISVGLYQTWWKLSCHHFGVNLHVFCYSILLTR